MARWVRDNRTGARRDIEAAMANGLNAAAEMLLGDANLSVPHDEGILESSGDVMKASAGDLNAGVGYNTPYAVIQHESPDFVHPGKGRHHWLERTLAERQEVYRGIVRDALRDATG